MNERMNKRTSELAQILKAAFENLRKSKVDYCVLRNYEDLPEYTTHDVDILVTESDFKHAVATVKQTAIECGWGVLAEVRQYKCHSLYFYYDKTNSVQFIAFDFVTDLPWGWLPTVNIQHVFASKIWFRGIPVASPGADAAMRLIKVLIRRQPITDKAAKHIMKGALAGPNDFKTTFAGILSKSLVESWFDCIKSERIGRLSEYSLRVRHSVFRHALGRAPVRSLIGAIKYFLSRIRRYWRGSLGAFVVLVGPDGAGKTTLALKLSEGIGTLVFRGTALYHSQFNFLPRLRTLGRRITGLKLKEIDFTQPHSGSKVKPTGMARCILYLLYYIWDYQLARLSLWLHRGRSRLILFDRYFYNYYYQKAYMRLPWLFLDFLRIAVPKPDVVLIMDADASVIYDRKPELDCPEIERQLEAINKLTERLHSIVLKRVQASQGLEVAENEAVRAIVGFVAAKNRKGSLAEIHNNRIINH